MWHSMYRDDLLVVMGSVEILRALVHICFDYIYSFQ